MKILGIDYGESKIGLALADDDNKLVYPLRVLRFENLDDLKRKLKTIINDEAVGKIVLGIPEGRIKRSISDFAIILREEFKLPLSFVDETLTTKEAQLFSIEAGIKRKKRKTLEDAYAACLILEKYFEKI
jgi:putative Holliday junction resolvase